MEIEVVNQLREELKEAMRRKLFLESELKSMDFCIGVMEKEITERASSI